jgi:aspartate aminotransferase
MNHQPNRKLKKSHIPDVNLNLNVRGLAQSATLEINDISAKLRSEGKHIYKLGLGQSPFPVPQSVVDELKVNAYQKDYLPVKGLPSLRHAVSEYYQRTMGLEFMEQDVLIGPGSKELMFLLQLVYYGDLVIPTPSWVSYAPQAHIIGRHVRWIDTEPKNHWLLTANELEKICTNDPNRPRIVILNYPSNPTGRTYTIDELKEIAKIARKYRVILLSDEIYGELNFKGKHVSIAKFYPEGTIISGGLSKWCGAGGWRLGTFTFPRSLRWLQDAMAVVASETFTSTSAPIQYAAVRAFSGDSTIEHYLWQSRRILELIGKYVTHKLKILGVNVPVPQGAFYLFLDFSSFKKGFNQVNIKNSVEMCKKLLEDTGVAILPGYYFGRPPDELTARLAYVDFDGSRALAAAEQFPLTKSLKEEFLYTYCPNVINAVDELTSWIRKYYSV